MPILPVPFPSRATAGVELGAVDPGAHRRQVGAGAGRHRVHHVARAVLLGRQRQPRHSLRPQRVVQLRESAEPDPDREPHHGGLADPARGGQRLGRLERRLRRVVEQAVGDPQVVRRKLIELPADAAGDLGHGATRSVIAGHPKRRGGRHPRRPPASCFDLRYRYSSAGASSCGSPPSPSSDDGTSAATRSSGGASGTSTGSISCSEISSSPSM